MPTLIAKAKNPDEPKDVVKSWLRNRSTVELLGLWERTNNPDFKGVEFDHFKKSLVEIVLRSFTIRVNTTNAKGIITKKGREGDVDFFMVFF